MTSRKKYDDMILIKLKIVMASVIEIDNCYGFILILLTVSTIAIRSSTAKNATRKDPPPFFSIKKK